MREDHVAGLDAGVGGRAVRRRRADLGARQLGDDSPRTENTMNSSTMAISMCISEPAVITSIRLG